MKLKYNTKEGNMTKSEDNNIMYKCNIGTWSLYKKDGIYISCILNNRKLFMNHVYFYKFYKNSTNYIKSKC